jgi:hypothetical protein
MVGPLKMQKTSLPPTKKRKKFACLQDLNQPGEGLKFKDSVDFFLLALILITSPRQIEKDK